MHTPHLIMRLCDQNKPACNSDGRVLQVVDTTDPTQITIANQLPIIDGIRYIRRFDNKLLLLGDEILLVDITNPAQPQVNGSFPTPGYAHDAVIIEDLIYVADGDGGLLTLRMLEQR